MNPPMIPSAIQDPDLFKNIPVQLNLRPTPPQTDSTQRLRTKLKLPKRLNMQACKILWSQELEDKELKKKREEEEKLRRFRENQRVTALVKGMDAVYKEKVSNIVKGPDMLQTSRQKLLVALDQMSQTRKVEPQKVKSFKVEFKGGKLLNNKSLSTKLQEAHQKTLQELGPQIGSFNHLTPSFKDFEAGFKMEKSLNLKKGQDPFMNLDDDDANSGSPFSSAVDLALDSSIASNLQTQLEVKNEVLSTISQLDIQSLSKRGYLNLQIMDLSMNKIQTIEGSIDCPNLRELTLADNLLKTIHPFLFSKLRKLQTLDLSINQIGAI